MMMMLSEDNLEPQDTMYSSNERAKHRESRPGRQIQRRDTVFRVDGTRLASQRCFRVAGFEEAAAREVSYYEHPRCLYVQTYIILMVIFLLCLG